MGKPTAEELQQALDTAIRMRESGNDPDFVAKSLLNLNYRLMHLEHVMTAAQHFLHAGQSVTEHRRLLGAIQAAEKATRDHETADDIPTLLRK
jgi:hypothetical protein